MSTGMTALRVAGRGLVAASALAAGAALGAIAERSLLRGGVVVTSDEDGEEFGSVRGPAFAVSASDGAALHVEID